MASVTHYTLPVGGHLQGRVLRKHSSYTWAHAYSAHTHPCTHTSHTRAHTIHLHPATYMCMHAHAHKHTCTYTPVHTCIQCTHIHTTHVHTPYTYAQPHTCVCMHMPISTHTHTHLYTHSCRAHTQGFLRIIRPFNM